MRMRRTLVRTVHCSTALTLCLGAVPAAAQESQAGASRLEEVYVTASKRSFEESIQTVPVSIQALSQSTLEQAGAQEFVDFAQMAPSLTLTAVETGTPQVSMRGIWLGAVAAQTTQENPLTGIYYDDLPVSLANFNPNLDLFDVQRIEILRGPQGTLYGAGSMGGNIRFVTNAPDSREWAAEVAGSYGQVADGGDVYDIKGMVNVPVSEGKFGLRMVGYSNWDDGYIDNSYLDIEDFDDNRRWGGRVSGRWDATDRLAVTLNVLRQEVEFEHGRHYIDGPPGTMPDPDDPQQNLYGNIPFIDEMTIYNGVVEFDLGWARFLSSTSYFERDMNNTGTAQDLMEAIFGLQLDSPNRSLWDNSDFIQEFRLSSPEDTRFNWVLGAFYNEKEQHHVQDFTIENAEDVFGFPTGGYGAPDDDILFYGDTTNEQSQFAVFGEGTYKFTDALHFTAGLRWFDWDQDFDLYFAGLFQGGPYTQAGRNSASEVTPKFALSYHGEGDWMVYASAAQGYRLGGLNEPVPPDLCADDLGEVGLTEAPLTFDSDSLWNYEIGAKSDFLDRRLRLNAALFYVDWTDVQTIKNLPNCGFYFTENVGDVVSPGVEFELAAVPVEGLTLTLSGAYIDAELDEDVPNLFAVKGDQVPNVPEWAFSVSAVYTRALTSSLDGYARVDYRYLDRRFTEFSRDEGIELDSYGSGNLHIGVETGDWDVSLFIRNFTDERGNIDGSIFQDVTSYSIERPRTIGVSFRYRT